LIKIKHIPEKVEKHSCDNCNREMSFVVEYSFSDDNGKEYNKITLCEDCANAVANLFYESMKDGKSFKYDKDEIEEYKEEI
jgi:hypothetical protein